MWCGIQGSVFLLSPQVNKVVNIINVNILTKNNKQKVKYNSNASRPGMQFFTQQQCNFISVNLKPEAQNATINLQQCKIV